MRYHLYTSSRNFYSNEDQPGTHCVRDFGTAMLGSQGKQATSMKFGPREKGCRHLAQVEDRTPVLDEQNKENPSS